MLIKPRVYSYLPVLAVSLLVIVPVPSNRELLWTYSALIGAVSGVLAHVRTYSRTLKSSESTLLSRGLVNMWTLELLGCVQVDRVYM